MEVTRLISSSKQNATKFEVPFDNDYGTALETASALGLRHTRTKQGRMREWQHLKISEG